MAKPPMFPGRRLGKLNHAGSPLKKGAEGAPAARNGKKGEGAFLIPGQNKPSTLGEGRRDLYGKHRTGKSNPVRATSRCRFNQGGLEESAKEIWRHCAPLSQAAKAP